MTIVSLKGSNVDLLHVLFGSVLALDDPTLILLAGSATVTLVFLALIYRPLVLECVDPGYLRSVSKSGALVHLGFLVVVVLNLVAGFHALGTLLAVGLIMLPAIAARFWTENVGGMIGVATLIGIVSSAAGILVSYHAGLPTGPTIILAAGSLYILSIILGARNGLLWPALPRRHLEA